MSPTDVVFVVLALLGLALTALGLGAGGKTGRDINNISDKLDQLHRKVGLFAKAFGAAILMVVISLWLSRCEGPTVTPTPGTDRIGYVGQPLPDPVGVLVQTKSGVAAGATVVFAPTNRDYGTASPDTVVADSTGRAQTVWTLGNKAGEQHLEARVLDGNSVWIIAQAREAPVATEIEITPDSAVLAFAGDVAPFSAEILDQYGDPFPGSVTWSSQRQCIFRAGSHGFATALGIAGADSIVAVFDDLRATALVRVRSGAR